MSFDYDVCLSSEVKKHFSKSKELQNFTFLEFGFTPRGIAKFMLDIDKRINGAGVTLPTALDGFGIVEELKEN